MTAVTDNTLAECTAKLETLLNQRYTDDILVIPLTEMPFDLDTIEAGAIAAQLSATRRFVDVTYNPVTRLFVAVNKRFARNLNEQRECVSVARSF